MDLNRHYDGDYVFGRKANDCTFRLCPPTTLWTHVPPPRHLSGPLSIRVLRSRVEGGFLDRDRDCGVEEGARVLSPSPEGPRANAAGPVHPESTPRTPGTQRGLQG